MEAKLFFLKNDFIFLPSAPARFYSSNSKSAAAVDIVSLLSPVASPRASNVSSSMRFSFGANVADGSLILADASVKTKSPCFAPRKTKFGSVPTPWNSPISSASKMPVSVCQSESEMFLGLNFAVTEMSESVLPYFNNRYN